MNVIRCVAFLAGVAPAQGLHAAWIIGIITAVFGAYQ